jgi:hypothetical protein
MSPQTALGEKTPDEFANEIAASRDLIGLQKPEIHPGSGTQFTSLIGPNRDRLFREVTSCGLDGIAISRFADSLRLA